MTYDFVNELGYLALATRLKRISEAMVHSGRQMYKQLDIAIEPNWFLLFKLLKKYEQLSITEIAVKLHFSHPSVITMIQKMEAHAYVSHQIDQADSRKRNYSLTDKAHKMLPTLEKIWSAGTEGIRKLFDERSRFLDELETLEIKLSEQDFMQRTLNELGNDETLS